MGASNPATSIGPELVGETAAEQDENEAERDEVGEDEADDRDRCQGNVADEGLGEPHQGPRHQGPHRRRQSIEELIEVGGQAGLYVEDREAEHEDEARQHEPEPGEETPELAAAQATEVDAELMGLGPGEHLVDAEELLEALLRDPMLLIDALLLD